MSLLQNYAPVPAVGSFVRCRVIETDSVDGVRAYKAGPLEYFVDGTEVTKAEFRTFQHEKQP